MPRERMCVSEVRAAAGPRRRAMWHARDARHLHAILEDASPVLGSGRGRTVVRPRCCVAPPSRYAVLPAERKLVRGPAVTPPGAATS